MTTLGQLLGQIRFKLTGLGATEDAASELAVPINASVTEIELDDATPFSRGVAEVDFELLRIKKVDTTTKKITLPLYGRGYMGTTPAAHGFGAEVTYNPLWPKSVVATEINGVLGELYPDLYAVRTFDTTITSRLGEVILPAGAVGVISVWLEGSDADTWTRVNYWDFRPDAGRVLALGMGGLGEKVRVVYAAPPGTFTLDGPAPLGLDFTTVTGLPARVADVIALGVAARLAPFKQLGQLPMAGAEARADAQVKPPDAMGNAAKLLYSEFRARVQAENEALVKEHPIRLHKVGR